MAKPEYDDEGPFRVHQLKDGDRYELSSGHAIYCTPSGPDHAEKNLTAASVLDTDPDAEWAGVDAGYAPDGKTMRAPDVAVGPAPAKRSGWIPGVPPLAVEFASSGQDEAGLERKIEDLLAGGTQRIWVVRLVGPRRVEEYRPGHSLRTYGADETLHAPGVLRNPVPVNVLYDRDAAHEATLRNLLQRRGYQDLESFREEALTEGREQGLKQGQAQGQTQGRAQGQTQGRAQSIFILLEDRGLTVSAAQRARILACTDSAELDQWLRRVLHVSTVEELFAQSDSSGNSQK